MLSSNLFGWDVSGLNVEAFLMWAQGLLLVLFCAWLGLLWRWRRVTWLLAGVLAANGYVWAITNYPLQRLYALGPSSDRVGNLGLCQVVAAGNSPLYTSQVAQLHFEPFWGLLVAALSGFEPLRVLKIYPFLPLVMVWGWALALYWALRPLAPGHPEGQDAPWSAWERATVAACATLLSSAALDFAGPYRVPWALMFLLKPNHALALAVSPLVLRSFAAIRTTRGRIGVGLLLHLLAWAFVLHMIYFCAGLVLFAAHSWWQRRSDRRRDLADVATVIGVNLLIVSPYLIMLALGYPLFQGSVRLMIPPWSPHALETTTRLGLVFWLGIWGLRVAWRRGDRLARVFVCQVVAAYLIWFSYYLLSSWQQAREKDEIYFWIRFLMAVAAGIGVWDLAGRAARALQLGLEPARRAAAIALLAFPYTMAYWWQPPLMDDYFTPSLPPLPERVLAPAGFLRDHTSRRAVVAGDREQARWVAALSGRRGLLSAGLHYPKDMQRRTDTERLLLCSADRAETLAAATAYGITHLIVTPELLAAYPPLGLAELLTRPQLRLVHLSGWPGAQYVAIFEIVGAGG